MNNNIKCPQKSHVPAGVTMETGATTITIIPAVTHKIYVSFNTEDCKAMNVDSMDQEQLDQIISAIKEEKPITKTKKLSLHDKKALVSNEGGKYSIHGYLKPLENDDVQYFKNLFLHLSCLTNLEFEIVEEKLHSKNTSQYKISICGTKDQALKENGDNGNKAVAYSVFSLEKNPAQCFIAVDDEDLGSEQDTTILQYRKNTLGHEFLHCLGLDHATYKSIKENKAHRSIMEDLSPIMKKCFKAKNNSLKKVMECSKLPIMPTGEDICTLNSLYGDSSNESLACAEIAQDLVAQYPYLALDEAGYISNYEL